MKKTFLIRFSYPGRLCVRVRFDGTEFNNFKQSRIVTKTLIHPDYKKANQEYDFCILTLQNPPIRESGNVTFIELANCTPLTGYTARIAGWGQTKKPDDYSKSQRLKVLDMKILSSRECKMRINSTNNGVYSTDISNESQICASGCACEVSKYK